MSTLPTVHLLDYGAGNVRSVRNAILSQGYAIIDVTSAAQLEEEVDMLIFPGVGNFRQAMEFLAQGGYGEALTKYIQSNKRFLGICLGLQTLFEGSEECPEQKVGLICNRPSTTRMRSNRIIHDARVSELSKGRFSIFHLLKSMPCHTLAGMDSHRVKTRPCTSTFPRWTTRGFISYIRIERCLLI